MMRFSVAAGPLLLAIGLTVGARAGGAARMVSPQATLSAAAVVQYEKVEVTFPPDRVYANPFDPAEAAVTGEFTTPSRRTVRVPGFYYQGYARARNASGEEVLAPQGAPVFKVRFAWGQVGRYRYRVTLRDRAGSRQVAAGTFRVVRGPSKGYVRLSKLPRYFQYSSGASCFPIGENLQEPRAGGTYDYDRWIGALADRGANYFRFMVGIIVNREDRLALEHLPARPGDGAGLGRYDQEGAWRIDHLMAVAERRGVLAQMCIDSFDQVQERGPYAPFGSWHTSPYNAANGGPAAAPADVFRNAEAKRLFRQRLRYMVARWGYSPSLFAWELWNEWNQANGYDSALMAGWHRGMARYVRGVDPWQHLISTSSGSTAGDPAVDRLPEMDFVQSHQYGAPDVAGSVSSVCLAKAGKYGKPHLFAECGADTSGRLDEDPVILGSVLHDGLWAAMLSGGAGTAMTWFWESVERHGLYREFSAVAAYARDVNWVKEDYRPTIVRLAFAAGRKPATFGTATLTGSADPWEPGSAAAKPHTFRVGIDGAVSDQETFSRVLHGVRNHPDLHNPVTLRVNYPLAGQFLIDVDRVAPAGAVLTVTLDGKPALSHDLAAGPTPSGRTRRGGEPGPGQTYALDVPAGPHTIRLENLGADWLYASYRLTNYLDAPNLRVLALANRRSALVWVQNKDHTWGHLRQGSVTPAAAAAATLSGLAPGHYQIERWDTASGKVAGTTSYRSSDGRVVIATPAGLVGDVAYKVKADR